MMRCFQRTTGTRVGDFLAVRWPLTLLLLPLLLSWSQQALALRELQQEPLQPLQREQLNCAHTGVAEIFEHAMRFSREGNIDQAEPLFDEILANCDPEHVAAMHGKATLLAIRGDLRGAGRMHAEAKALDASVLPPQAVLFRDGDQCNGLGDVYWVASFGKKAMAENPDDKATELQTHVGLATQLEDSGLLELAIAHLKRAQALDPTSLPLRLRRAMLMPMLYDSFAHIQEARQHTVDALRALHEQVLSRNESLQLIDQLSLPSTFHFVYQGYGNDSRLLQSLWTLYSDIHPAFRYVDPSLPPTGRRRGGSRLRIGVVSAYIRRHSVCKLFCNVVQGLAKTHEVTVFSATPSEDEWTQSVEQAVHEFVRVKPGFLVNNRHLVPDRSIDVLLYLDIGMDMGTSVWGAARLAPLQIMTWGHPSSSGMLHMDYFVSSALYEPAWIDRPDHSEGVPARYAEQLVLFDSLGMSFSMPKEAATARQAGGVLSESTSAAYRQHLGLPAAPAPLVLIPQHLAKFHPHFDTVVLSLLTQGRVARAPTNDGTAGDSDARAREAAPPSRQGGPVPRLVITYDPNRSHWRYRLEARWRSVLRARFEDPAHMDGTDDALIAPEERVDAAMQQIVFVSQLSRQDFFRLVTVADVMVDPFPFGGGVTTMEALSVCTPVVTLPEMQSVLRLTAGFIESLHDPELSRALIAHSVEDMHAKVLALTSDGDRALAARVRKALCSHAIVDGLFEGQSRVAEEEWQRFIERAAAGEMKMRSA